MHKNEAIQGGEQAGAMGMFRNRTLVVLACVLTLVVALVWFGSTRVLGASTATTIPSASNTPSGVTFVRPFTTVPSQTPTRIAVPVVPSSSTACTPSLISATVTGVGPDGNNPSTGQLLISLNSSAGCSLLGFPSVSMSDSTGAVAAEVTNGGTAGANLVPSIVTLGSSVPGSFIIQYNQNLNCPVDTSLGVEIPGSSVPIAVNLNATLVAICGAIKVTPIIQGNNALEYL